MTLATPPNVSAIILTLNEEATISAAISSLSWCNEIFVVDSNSQDSTRTVAASLGAKVHVHQQEGRFLISEQRNWALQSLPIQSEWVLFLDADEESTLEFSQSVMDSVNTASDATAFYAAPAFMYQGKWLKHISGFPNWHPRIVKVGSDARFSGGVWEDFDQPETAGYIAEPYIHRTNAKGLSDWIGKHLRYASWEADSICNRRSSKPDTVRRSRQRQVRYALGPFRKYAALFYLSIIRKGLLDGREGRSYLKRMFIYELLIDEAINERSTREQGGVL